jgi:hypothetical protein
MLLISEKSANIFLFNRLARPGGGGILYSGFTSPKVTNIHYYGSGQNYAHLIGCH